MAMRVLVGGENFDELREDGCYYVDKTEMLYELIHVSRSKVTLFTRPRRFGKTLTMRMMESFLDVRRDSRDVFEGLSIMRHDRFCREWMNRHPVLFITLKDVEGLRFETAYAKLRAVISDVCQSHLYLAESGAVTRFDKETLLRLCGKTATDDEVQGSLLLLTRMMHAHFGRPAVLLIDEYDVPLAKANEEKEAGERYYAEMLDVMRGLMGMALKSNDHLRLAVACGCLRVAKESIFTGVNNFRSYSVLDEDFSHAFGFTQEEVDALLLAADRRGKADVIKRWYDGYVFGSDALYCPWDVMSYVSELLKREDAFPKNYWADSSGNGVIRDFARHRDFDVSDKFETLMNGGTIEQTISEELAYDTLHETEDNLWSLLLMTGYLTKAGPGEGEGAVRLRIPNAEVMNIFECAVVSLFREGMDRARQLELMDALWAGDAERATGLISDFLFDTISYHDYHEDYYHAFLTGIFVGLGYGVKSNREQGTGRTDITLRDRRNRRALVIEAKKSDGEGQMGHDCDEALDQIVEKEYARGMDGYEVTCYGIAFFRKRALVKVLA